MSAGPELFKLSSLLLQYPSEELIAAREELAAAVARLGRSRPERLLRSAWERWAAGQPDRLRRDYVQTFDFQRRHSLYLTYHSYGDRRERGMALIALKQRYEAAGLELETEELPDYLPLLLEFRALSPEVGTEALIEHREALEVLRGALAADQSLWALPVASVCAALPRLSRRQRERADRMAVEGPPEERVGLEPFAPPEFMPPSGPEQAALPVRGVATGGGR